MANGQFTSTAMLRRAMDEYICALASKDAKRIEDGAAEVRTMEALVRRDKAYTAQQNPGDRILRGEHGR